MIPLKIFLIFILSLSTVAAEKIRVAASDLLAAYIAPTIKNFAEANDLDITVDSLGSLPALDRLKSDQADLAIIAIPEGKEGPGERFRLYPFAYDSALIIVNEKNPINEISIPGLGGIFGSSGEFNFTFWGELGLSGWGSRSIKPLAGSAKDSISLELFRHSVLAGGTMKPGVTVVRDSEIEAAIASNITSIGIISRSPQNKNLKVLMVSDEARDTAYGPSLANINVGDYPIRLPFYVAFDPRNQAKIKELLRFLLSEEIADSLSQNNLFPLPSTARTQFLLDLNFQE